MDTTAAAELGGGLVDGGDGTWDTGGRGEGEGWSTGEKRQGWGEREGAGRGGHNRSGSSMEPPHKRMRNMGGGGDGYGPGSGNFGNASTSRGFAGGYGPGGQMGGNPSMRNGVSPGASSSTYQQSPASPAPSPASLPPGTPGAEPSPQGNARGRGLGSIFYKTKLCSKFRSGNCPYSMSCNFAHGMEELRRPPPGWEDGVGPQESVGAVGGSGGGGANVGGNGTGGKGGGVGGGRGSSEAGSGEGGSGGNGGLPVGNGGSRIASQNSFPGPNQSYNRTPSPAAGGTGGGGGGGGGPYDVQRFHKTRPCKKYFSEMGCPYGDRCNFLHEEPNAQTPSKSARESVVLAVSTNAGASGSGAAQASAAAIGGGATGGASGGGVGTGEGPGPGIGTGTGPAAGPGGPIQRPPNWKTRLCNKWETTGNCPFGEKCHFAHGTADLQRYGGGPMDPSSSEGIAAMQMGSKFGVNSPGDPFGNEDEGSPFFADDYPRVGNPQHRKSSATWKGPKEGISLIYGDWLSDDGGDSSDTEPGRDAHFSGHSMRGVRQKPGDPFSWTPNGKDQRNSYLKANQGSVPGFPQLINEMNFAERAI